MGRVKDFLDPDYVKCSSCNGRGRKGVCEKCEGAGQVQSENGSQTILCNECQGDGKGKCLMCQGSGELEVED